VREFAPVHPQQLLTYLKVTGNEVGLLINFNVPVLKDGVRRVMNSTALEGSASSATGPREALGAGRRPAPGGPPCRLPRRGAQREGGSP
jgi:hypothetical protein